MGESGIDEGGLRREFFSLLSKSVAKRYMCHGFFIHNSVALQVSYIHVYIHYYFTHCEQDEVFLRLGYLAVTSLVQGGSEHRILSSAALSYIQGKSLSAIGASIDDIPDPEIQLVANQVCDKVVMCADF